MSHLTTRCTCGRRMHFTKKARKGTTWTCWQCGRSWHIADRGRPLYTHKSKPPGASCGGVDEQWWKWIVGGLVVLWVVGRGC